MGKRHERCRQQKRYGHCTNIVVDNATRCSPQMSTDDHQDYESKRAELDQRRHVVIVQTQLGWQKNHFGRLCSTPWFWKNHSGCPKWLCQGDWANSRLKKLSQTDLIRDNSKVGSGFGKNVSNWLNRDKAYPTNVLHLATECNNKNHSAAFPEELPEWFIKLFTKQNDTVLDPFMGSGTTLVVANRLRRNSIGIDIVPEYYEMVRKRLQPVELYLLEPKAKYEKTKPERRIAIR